jgi:hypothetical protein
LTVEGTGWAPREQVTISLSENADGSNAVRLARTNANRQGRFRIERTIQQFAAPTIYVVVTNASGQKVIAPLQLVAPTPAP